MLELVLDPALPGEAVLQKDGKPIGRARLQGDTLEHFFIDPPFRRKGYGTWFFRRLLRTLHVAPTATLYAAANTDDTAAAAFLCKFGFSPHGAGLFCRQTQPQVNALSIAHDFLHQHVRAGAFAIDATAGNGHDTELLCRLVGAQGRVLALDIQPAAVQATNNRLAHCGLTQGHVICCNHANLAQLASPGSVDAIVFNLGYLPGGDHELFTTPASSLPALNAALDALRVGGVLTVCAYSGGVQGTTERDAVLQWAHALRTEQYDVFIECFEQRAGHPPIVICIRKQTHIV